MNFTCEVKRVIRGDLLPDRHIRQAYSLHPYQHRRTERTLDMRSGSKRERAQTILRVMNCNSCFIGYRPSIVWCDPRISRKRHGPAQVFSLALTSSYPP